MPVLPLLKHPASYRACIQNLLTDGREVLDYWLTLFENHLETLAMLPVVERGHLKDQVMWPEFSTDYLAGLAQLRSNPALRGNLTVLELTVFRDERLHARGIFDPFELLKNRENQLALSKLHLTLRELGPGGGPNWYELLARGLFAGNTFDMGSRAVVAEFEAQTFDFHAAREKLKPRPWPVDDLDDWFWATIQGPRYKKCLFFVDNAGADIVLGVIPFVLHLAEARTEIVLAANSGPSLNDITADELSSLLANCAQRDERVREQLEAGRIRVVASGCCSPLIDLSQVSEECCEASKGCDLVVLEGMGRAIESNYDA